MLEKDLGLELRDLATDVLVIIFNFIAIFIQKVLFKLQFLH